MVNLLFRRCWCFLPTTPSRLRQTPKIAGIFFYQETNHGIGTLFFITILIGKAIYHA
jgi:hypothetical protein